MGIIIDDDGIMHKVFTKADVVAMLTELQIQFEEKGCENMRDCWWLIEEKINALKENKKNESY